MRVQKGEQIREPHLAAHRLSREEVLYVWLGYIRQIVQGFFTMNGQPVDERKLFEYSFPEPLWDRIDAYLANLRRLPVWVKPRPLANSVWRQAELRLLEDRVRDGQVATGAAGPRRADQPDEDDRGDAHLRHRDKSRLPGHMSRRARSGNPRFGPIRPADLRRGPASLWSPIP